MDIYVRFVCLGRTKTIQESRLIIEISKGTLIELFITDFTFSFLE